MCVTSGRHGGQCTMKSIQALQYSLLSERWGQFDTKNMTFNSWAPPHVSLPLSLFEITHMTRSPRLPPLYLHTASDQRTEVAEGLGMRLANFMV